MNCLEFRRTLAADPGCRAAEFLAHRQACRGCARAAAEAVEFDRRLARALAVSPPPDLERRILLRQAFTPRRGRLPRLAAAASLVVAFVSGAMLPGLLGDRSLGAAVVEHVADAPHSPPPAEGVDAATLAMMLEAIGIRVERPPSRVLAAGLCAVRQRTVAHFIVGDRDAPTDVLVMPGESVPGRQRIHGASREGLMLPVEGGVLALLGAPGAPLEALGHSLGEGIRIAR